MKPFATTEDGDNFDEIGYYSLVLEQAGVPFVDTDHCGRIFSIRVDHDECDSTCTYFNFDRGVVWSQVMSASDEVTESRLPREYWDAIPDYWDADEYISWVMGDYM